MENRRDLLKYIIFAVIIGIIVGMIDTVNTYSFSHDKYLDYSFVWRKCR